MLELAKNYQYEEGLVRRDQGFDDRYELAVAELVKAKIEGRTLPKRTAPPPAKSTDLLQALRNSAGSCPRLSRSLPQRRRQGSLRAHRKRSEALAHNARLDGRNVWRCDPIGKAI